MSLEDEMLEQNSMYQHVMQQNELLKELLIDYEALVSDVPDESTNNVDFLAWETRHMELQQRATAALSQE